MSNQVIDCGARNERDEYFELVLKFPLKLISDDEMLREASSIIDELLDRESLSIEAQEYLDALTVFIEKYEEEHHPIEPPEDSEILKHLMEAKGVRAAEVARETSICEPTLCDILKGRRQLTRGHIGALARYFNVPATVFAFPTD